MSVRGALLGLLAQRPRHGYELRAAFEALVGGEENWDVKPAQVYATLARLHEGGLAYEEGVEQDGGPEKRIYALTEEGEAELKAWLASPVDYEHERDEFFVKLMVSLATDAVEPSRVIQMQRAALYQQLHAVTARRQRSDPRTELAQMLLLDKATMYLEADLRWLDMVEARLDEVRRQPIPEPESKPRGRPRKTWLRVTGKAHIQTK